MLLIGRRLDLRFTLGEVFSNLVKIHADTLSEVVSSLVRLLRFGFGKVSVCSFEGIIPESI